MSNRPQEKGLNLQAFEDKSEYGSLKALNNYSNTSSLHVCSTTASVPLTQSLKGCLPDLVIVETVDYSISIS